MTGVSGNLELVNLSPSGASSSGIIIDGAVGFSEHEIPPNSTLEPSNAQLLNAFQSQSDRLFSALSNIENSLGEVVNQNAAHARDIEELRHTSVTQGDCLKMLDGQVQQLFAQTRKFSEFIRNNQAGTQQLNIPQDFNIDQIAGELQERLNRSLNIILFNLQDRSDVNYDQQQVTEILNSVGINSTNIRIRRIGRAVRERPRAIVITLSSRAEVLQVLRNRRNIPADPSVSEDRTRNQRDTLAALRLRVRDHNSTHPDDQWRIKFVNNSPVIISVKDSQQIPKND